jgi:CBS domain-containing protein
LKVKEIMDEEFIYVSPDQNIDEVSIIMEKGKKFTTPVVDKDIRLVGWITSFNITQGLRDGKKKISEVMHSTDSVVHVNENDPARLAVLKITHNKLVNVPVLNDEEVLVGVVRSVDIVKTLSHLYEIKVYKIFKALEKELKGVSWDELMEASAIITTRRTGEHVTAEEYELRIKNATFGEAIWATGGLEKFFVGLIAIGQMVTAKKVARARK